MLPVKSKSSGETADATTNNDDAMDLLLHVSCLLVAAGAAGRMMMHPSSYIGC